MNEYVTLPIIGAAVSALMQVLKAGGTFSPLVSRMAVVCLSLFAGYLYWIISNSPDGAALWSAALQVLLYANAVYAFLIKPLAE